MEGVLVMGEGLGSTVKLGLCEYKVEHKFVSRKNQVYLIKRNNPGAEEYLVYKRYSRPDRMYQEIEMLRRLRSRGVAVPRIRSTGDHYIVLEYLAGTLLLDSYCRLEDAMGSSGTMVASPTRQLLSRLVQWFKAFHLALPAANGKQLIMGDVNFRNFIVLDDQVYGVDLEECREGTLEEEVGSLCAFALTYSPSFTMWKLSAVGELLRLFTFGFHLDPALVKREIERQLLFLGGIRGTVSEMEGFLGSKIWEQFAFKPMEEPGKQRGGEA